MENEKLRTLRARAHPLKPVVITGQHGVSPEVLREIDGALTHHELIKVRLNAPDRETRAQMYALICRELAAEPVQIIGHVATIYRHTPEPGTKRN